MATMSMSGSYNKGNGSGNRGRAYGLMLLMAFGVALLGVMLLHKLRERRIFNLLLKDKDSQLISLHLLFQKEREYGREMKKKTEEMKVKMQTLRARKTELDSRLLEMKSTIESLKDEQKAMESALEEKQNEIKMQGERDRDSGNENPQLIALEERLRQKEVEIEDLRHRLEHPLKVWSVSTDDPSNPTINLNVTGSFAREDKIEVSSSKQEWVNKSTSFMEGKNLSRGEDGSEGKYINFRGGGIIAARVEDGSKNRAGITDSRETAGELLQTLQHSQDDGSKNRGDDGDKSLDEGQENKNKNKNYQKVSFGVEDKKRAANGTDAIVDAGENVWKSRDELRWSSKGGMKLEMPKSSRMGWKRENVSKTKRKKWRILAKNRWLENKGNSKNNGVTILRSTMLSKIDQDGLNSREEGAASNENNPLEVKKAAESTDANLLMLQNPEDAEDLKNRVPDADINQQVEEEELANRSIDDEGTNITSNAKKQSPDEFRQPEDQDAGGSRQNMNSRDVDKAETSAERAKATNKHDKPEALVVKHIQEPETDGADDIFRASGSNFKDDTEEYKEETDESEFY